MTTFLSKISRLDSIQDVALLSNQGETLFFDQKNSTPGNRERASSYWNEIISNLDQPQVAEFTFTNGRYYLTRTPIGYLIIGLNNDKALEKIKQACATILTKLSDPALCKRLLLNLLTQPEDILKPNIIRELRPYADEEVATVLMFLLRREKEIAPLVKEELLLLICQTLGYCSNDDAIAVLKAFLASRKSGVNTPNEQVIEAVRISIEQLEQNHPPKKLDGLQKAPPPGVGETVQADIPKKQQIDELLDRGKKDEAVALIMQLIEQCAGKKQFATADRLRDYLIKINPMALLEIIRAADVIEEAKQSGIDKKHLETWSKLTEILSSEEFSALYHAMTLRSYTTGKTIVQQGSTARTLLFINGGQVQLQALNQDTLIPLSVKGAGEIIGIDTFFEASVWTDQVKSLGCEVFLLSRQKLDSLKEQHPSLEPKLSDFCASFQSVSAELRKTGRNRRQFKRKNISGRISFAVLNTNGTEITTEAKGDLIDISTGGVAFSIHSSQKKNAAALFGRQLRISFQTTTTTQIIIRRGTVQAVRDIDLIGNEYSLHLEFSEQLSYSELQQIAGASPEARS